MPYIKQKDRARMDRGGYPETPGELNYLISKSVAKVLEKKPTSYTRINALIGVLECAKLELYRRVAAPYEDSKCEENGDVY